MASWKSHNILMFIKIMLDKYARLVIGALITKHKKRALRKEMATQDRIEGKFGAGENCQRAPNS
ncbi:hypothetical protein J7K93_03840 [bacterium]|nr:hypothetical protein [bacterium]